MKDLSIGEDPKKGHYIKGLVKIPTTSSQKALEILKIGALNRQRTSKNINFERLKKNSSLRLC